MAQSETLGETWPTAEPPRDRPIVRGPNGTSVGFSHAPMDDSKGVIIKGVVCKGIVCKGVVCKGFVSKGVICKGSVSKGVVCKGFVYKGVICKGFVSKGVVCKSVVCERVESVQSFAARTVPPSASVTHLHDPALAVRE